MGCCTSVTALPKTPTGCSICFAPTTVISCGSKTASPHTLCLECLKNMIQSWADPTSGDSNLIDVGHCPQCQNGKPVWGALYCPFKAIDGCAGLLISTAFLPLLPRQCRVQFTVAANRRMERFKMEQNRELRLTPPPVMLRDRSEREIHIENEMLLRHCPKCQVVFDAFDGCFAVLCANCRTYFCAWCLKFYGNSQQVHQHVATCADNPDKKQGVWGNTQKYQEVMQSRAVSKVRDFLCRERDPGLTKRVRPVLQVSFGKKAASEIERAASGQEPSHGQQQVVGYVVPDRPRRPSVPKAGVFKPRLRALPPN